MISFNKYKSLYNLNGCCFFDNKVLYINNGDLFEYEVLKSFSDGKHDKFYQIDLMFKKLMPRLVKEFHSHYEDSIERINKFSKNYFLSFFLLNHVIDPFSPNKFVAWGVKIMISSFILNGFNKESFVSGIKEVLLLPYLSYLFSLVIPSIYTKLLVSLITGMIRGIVARMIFLPESESYMTVVRLLPGIMLAGAIRGLIMNTIAVWHKDLDFTEDEIFNLSMVARFILEPQIKKCEKMSIF